MNIQNLKENILVKKVLPILKILDFRQYFFFYIFTEHIYFVFFLGVIDITKLMNEFPVYTISFMLSGILLTIMIYCLGAEILIRTLLKILLPDNQILLKLESIPQKVTIFWSAILYILFALGATHYVIVFFLK